MTTTMSETVTDTQLTGEEYDAALARLRDWAQQIANAEADADRNSLDHAIDLAAVFKSERWVAELPPHSDLKKRKIRRNTVRDFANWTKRYPEKVGKAYGEDRVGQLLKAAELMPLLKSDPVGFKGEKALRPVTGQFAREHPNEVTEVVRRAREIADGGSVTEKIMKRALKDHNNVVRPPVKIEKVAAPVVTDRHAAEKEIRTRFQRMLAQGRRQDAGDLLNILIADYKAGAVHND